MGSDDIFDILLLLLVIAILTPIMLKNTVPLFKGDIGGFDTLIEKTEQRAEEEIVSVDNIITKEDLLLMIVVAEDIKSNPSILKLSVDKDNDGKITNSDIKEDDELSEDISINDIINNKLPVLNTINSYIPDNNINLKLCTLVGANGIQKWVVLRK